MSSDDLGYPPGRTGLTDDRARDLHLAKNAILQFENMITAPADAGGDGPSNHIALLLEVLSSQSITSRENSSGGATANPAEAGRGDEVAIHETHPALRLPAREIPVPRSVSEEARAVLALGPLMPGQQEWPSLEDLDGWRSLIAERDLRAAEMTGARSTMGAEVTEFEVDDAQVYEIRPEGVLAGDRGVYLELHGGAFIQGGGALVRSRGIDNANRIGALCWSVDYRMPPDHPYPSPLDDCVAAYRGLLKRRLPEEIVIGGVSAGANLAAATILRARDEGLPLPAGAVLATPVADLTGSGDTCSTNLGLDNILTGRHTAPLELYAGSHDLRHPYLSPVFADFQKGFPPTLLMSGTRDVLLSDTVRLHRKLRAAGIAADLHIWEAAGHGGFLGRAPEDQERAEETRRFLAECWRDIAR